MEMTFLAVIAGLVLIILILLGGSRVSLGRFMIRREASDAVAKIKPDAVVTDVELNGSGGRTGVELFSTSAGERTVMPRQYKTRIHRASDHTFGLPGRAATRAAALTVLTCETDQSPRNRRTRQ